MSKNGMNENDMSEVLEMFIELDSSILDDLYRHTRTESDAEIAEKHNVSVRYVRQKIRDFDSFCMTIACRDVALAAYKISLRTIAICSDAMIPMTSDNIQEIIGK